MSRGRRYDTEPKLNIKKVIAVIIAIAVIIMFIFMIKGILSPKEDKGKISSQSYFSAYKNQKWGVINANGEDVIDPSYEEMIVIPNTKTDVFLCTYDVNYDTGEYKTKALNSKNEEILTGYEQIEAISNKDENSQLWYEENVLKVKKEGKYGLIHLNGKQVLKTEYDEITAVPGIKNAFVIKQGQKLGIADNEGKIIITPQYQEITNLGKDNKSGYIVKAENGKYGIVDYSAQNLLDTKYDEIKKVYGNDCYVVVEQGKQKLIAQDGSDILTTGFEEIRAILKNKDEGIIYSQKGKQGVMKLTGEITIPAEYEELKEAKSGILIAKKDSKYGVIDLTKAEKIGFQYETIAYNDKADIYLAEDKNFNTSLYNNEFELKVTGFLINLDIDKGYFKIRIDDSDHFYNLKFEEKKDTEVLTTNTLFLSKKDGKYGFVDKQGNVIVDYQYDDATEQNNYGFAGIKKDGKWGSIDNKGNIVQEPVYNLEEYMLVDFIGRWHLGLDLNINYYNQD